MTLSRADILAKTDLPTRDVPVPEWGDGATVRVRCLTSKESFAWSLSRIKAASGEGPEPTAHIVALGAIGEDGTRLFNVQDSDALAELRGDVIERIADEVMKLSGLLEDGTPDVEPELGNSDATLSGDSGSDSLETSDAPSPN